MKNIVTLLGPQKSTAILKRAYAPITSSHSLPTLSTVSPASLRASLPAIKKLYSIKVRDVKKPMAICHEDEILQPIKPVRTSPTPNIPKVDEDLAFRLILESERNIPSGILPPLESTAISIPPVTEAHRLSHSLPDKNPLLDDILVTHWRPKRAPSPACFASSTLPEEEPIQAKMKQPTPPSPVPVIEPAKEPDPPAERGESPCTFEDLLVDYSNLNMVKPPEVALPQTASSSKDSSPGFEHIFGDERKQGSPFSAMLPKVNQERGLVKQDYRCSDCSRPIGLIYGPFRICGFTGGYYCQDCHSEDESIIPVGVFLNGDFSKRKISSQIRSWFREIELDPIFDAVKFNPHIYSFQRYFANLLTIRSQLYHLSAFLLTCRMTDDDQEFQKRLYGREHLYKVLHKYALFDLPFVQSEQLCTQLNKLVAFGKQYVADCICKIPEACRADSGLFPFELESTYRYATSGSVFHSHWMDRFKPCFRCERWKAKEKEEQQLDQDAFISMWFFSCFVYSFSSAISVKRKK